MARTTQAGLAKSLVIVLSALLLLSLMPGTASAQTAVDTRPTTTTASGDTGLWLVPTAEVLRHKTWSFSFYEVNADDGQGFMDIVRLPVTFGVGLGKRTEIFGNWSVVTRIDRDTRPLFFESDANSMSTGTGGGIQPDYPLIHGGWTGNKVGDLWVGGKFKLLDSDAVGLAVRAQVKLPVGDEDIGVSTGKADFQIDGIISRAMESWEVAGFGGFMMRGNPTGYELTNGFRWGAGVAFPNIFQSGFRATAELVGEMYLNESITAPPGVLADDGSVAPLVTFLKNPVLVNVGLTWQARNGFFIGGGGSWNVAMKPRSEASGPGVGPFPDVAADQGGFVVRIGYSPGANRRTVAAPAPTPAPTAAPTAAPTPPAAVVPPPVAPPVAPPVTAAAPPANRPPTVQVQCDPCRVEVGRATQVTATAQDPDGDPLTYRWTAPSGTLTDATSSQARWTAPTTPGRAEVTVTVTDNKGGSTSATTSIEVVRTAKPGLAFENVYFDFDKSDLRPDTIRVLNDVVKAMQAEPGLSLDLEGHTCNIGTSAYNQALGERRAKAVRDYLVKMKVEPARLRTVSHGEDHPDHDNAVPSERPLNRRVVLVVHQR